jgi:hypothetical protein
MVAIVAFEGKDHSQIVQVVYNLRSRGSGSVQFVGRGIRGRSYSSFSGVRGASSRSSASALPKESDATHCLGGFWCEDSESRMCSEIERERRKPVNCVRLKRCG